MQRKNRIKRVKIRLKIKNLYIFQICKISDIGTNLSWFFWYLFHMFYLMSSVKLVVNQFNVDGKYQKGSNIFLFNIKYKLYNLLFITEIFFQFLRLVHPVIWCNDIAGHNACPATITYYINNKNIAAISYIY